MLAVSTANGQYCGFRGKRGGTDDDTWDTDKVGDVVRCEVADGQLRGRRVEEQLVLRKLDVPLRGVDNALCACLERGLELCKISLYILVVVRS